MLSNEGKGDKIKVWKRRLNVNYTIETVLTAVSATNFATLIQAKNATVAESALKQTKIIR